jgi:hypothetical protein
MVPINWSKVTLDHVQQACDLYDAGAVVPKRPAKSTFLVLNGKNYPAKFIRGLAHRIATGIELDPNKDFTGGEETVRFFASLGLATSASVPPSAATSPLASLPPSVPTPISTHSRRKYEPQKQALFDLLKKLFGTVECEVEFPWLVVPKTDELKEPVSSIFQPLQTMRGFSTFAGAGRSLRCDFYIPSQKMIVEYDERQHFTIQRAKTLELYLPDISLDFDRQEWIKSCNSIKATDPNPPYRDEQRAFYDSLRDILAAQNGYRLVRFRQGDFDWTSHDAETKVISVFSTTVPVIPCASQSVEKSASEIRKIALVSHDYNMPDSRGLFDYSEHFTRINKICDEQGCDTMLYALYSWDSTSPATRSHNSIFEGLKNIQRVVIEVGHPPHSFDHVEVWVRDQQQPIQAHQRFATSSSSISDKQQFLHDLPSRQIGTALLVICGETNIASLVRGSDRFNDPFGFADRLRDLKTCLLLNPIHDYMRRYEMREKRRFYSQGGRTVISVWNQGKGKEAWLPWTVFRNGVERTDCVKEIDRPFAERPDIRIGVLDTSSLG